MRSLAFLTSAVTMAWTCSATTNDALIDNLVRKRLLRTPRAERVMRQVDRRHFVPRAGDPYADSPQSLPCAATISAPHMHATALQLLEPYLQPGASALDVGAGSGYFAALMAVMVGPSGKVVAIEHAPPLADLSEQNIRTYDPQILENGSVDVRAGDGRQGAPDEAPFSAIHVGAAAPFLPRPLLDQLAPNGAMIIPVGPELGSQNLLMVTKDPKGAISQRFVCGVRYVPLCDLNEQISSN